MVKVSQGHETTDSQGHEAIYTVVIQQVYHVRNIHAKSLSPMLQQCGLLLYKSKLKIDRKVENNTWFPQIMTYLFQGLLGYIFKDFSRTFLCSFKHSFAKKW